MVLRFVRSVFSSLFCGSRGESLRQRIGSYENVERFLLDKDASVEVVKGEVSVTKAHTKEDRPHCQCHETNEGKIYGKK